jgi:ABC-type transport system involved in multi-copper enzyme maturation permease subunit
MNSNVLTAVFRRNFFSYFANPTGYVFICMFVFLTAIAAFWPDDFFNANLANLDQLNKYFAIIMLIYIPAITMGIWAEETRQGTDELLLTMPATDLDIVLGKYLAAVAIYTVALLISLVSNFLVLKQLGNPDLGLYLCTHLGYWFLGLAMLAIGMVASFLTRNLTVAYVIGALLNAPLVFMAYISVVPGLTHAAATEVRQWSMGGQCQEFGRGILSFSGIVYFLSITAIMLYVCMVLIGRRNWARGEETGVQSGHYTLRVLALTVVAVAAVFAVQSHDVRVDATSERLSSLSPATITLVRELKHDYDEAVELQPKIAKLETVVKEQELEKKKKDAAKAAAAPKSTSATPAAKGAGDVTPPAKGSEAAAATPAPANSAELKEGKNSAAKAADSKAIELTPPLTPEAKQLKELREKLDSLKVQGPVRIDAFISTEVPESYVQTRINLKNVLQAFKDLGGDMVELKINDMPRGDPLAEIAKTRYNILPRDKFDNTGGSYKRDKIFMGVAFTCGLEKMVLPFVERGLPAEYELVRSLCTVTRQKRKRIGVLETDAHVNGNFSQMGMTPAWQLIDELKKQYEVVQVSPADLAGPRKPGETKRYDVLLAIQPSAMGPQELDGFVAAVRGGQPTVIFEDPFFFPYWVQGVSGTYQPRQQQQNPMMGFGREAQEKGDIRALWRLLGIDFSDGGDADEFNPMAGPQQSRGTERVVWQRYSPYPKLGDIVEPEFVFVDNGCGAKEPFCESDPISSKLQHMFFPGPGFIEDTPQVVKRLIAKWHNHQYSKQLEQGMKKIETEFEAAKAANDREKAYKLINDMVELDEEMQWVSAGGEGKKIIRPDQIDDDATLKSLLKDLGEGVNLSSVGDLRRDIAIRFPIRISVQGIPDADIARLADEEPDALRAEATKLTEEAAKLKGQPEAAAKAATAKLAESIAKLKEELSLAVKVSDLTKYAEGVVALQITDRKFTPLVETGSDAAGTVPVGQLTIGTFRGEGLSPLRSLFYQPSNGQQYVLAAHIQGKLADVKASAPPLNVVLVGDVEMISDQFFAWREQGKMPGQDIDFDFDNVTFVLNALDTLANDDRFLELRKRRPQHRTLTNFDAKKLEALKEGSQARKVKSAEHDAILKKAIEDVQAHMKQIRLDAGKKGADPNAIAQKEENAQRVFNRRLEEDKAKNDQKYSDELRKINDDQEAKILAAQSAYKFWSVVIPPIPPLVVAALVYMNRRAKEREGVSSKRLR